MGRGVAEETCVILEGTKTMALASRLEVPGGMWGMGMVAYLWLPECRELLAILLASSESFSHPWRADTLPVKGAHDT